MSRKCELTNRSAMSGNKRSNALNATKRKWNLNLQNVTVEINGKKEKMTISSKALRTMKKQNPEMKINKYKKEAKVSK